MYERVITVTCLNFVAGMQPNLTAELDMVMNQMFIAQHGDRQNVTNILFIVTDQPPTGTIQVGR